jgi:hypothetical protein
MQCLLEFVEAIRIHRTPEGWAALATRFAAIVGCSDGALLG